MRKATVPQIRPSCPRTATARQVQAAFCLPQRLDWAKCPLGWLDMKASYSAKVFSVISSYILLKLRFFQVLSMEQSFQRLQPHRAHRRFYDTIVPRFLQRKNKLSSPTGGHAHRERQRLPCFVLAWEPSAFPGAVGCGLPGRTGVRMPAACVSSANPDRLSSWYEFAGSLQQPASRFCRCLREAAPYAAPHRGWTRKVNSAKKWAALHASPAQKESQYFLYFHLVLENKAQKKNRLFPACSS